MYDLGELVRWRWVGTTGLDFRRSEPRTVRIQVLAEKAVGLYVEFGGVEGDHFIGRVEGYQVIAFAVPGAFKLTADGDGAKVWTPELEDTGAVEIPDAVSFTKMMTRRTRNPELELMMKKVQDNMERRIAQVEGDVHLQLARERRIAEKQRQADERARAEQAERDAHRQPSAEDADEDEAAEA